MLSMMKLTLRTVLFAVAALWMGGRAGAQSAQPLSLADCRARALAHSEDLKQAGNRVSQAELDVKIAAAAALPKFDASAVGAYVAPDIDMLGMELRMRGMYMADLNLTQPLYAGGKIRAGRRLARIGKDVALEQQRMTRMDVLVEADQTYWTCVAVRGKVRMLERYAAQMDTLYRQTETACAAGMATANDLLRIEAKRSEIRYQLQKARSGAELCRLSLCRVVGAESGALLEPSDTLPEAAPPSGLTADLAARPELRMLEKQVEAGGQQVRMARADMLPTVGLTADYTYYGNIKLHTPGAGGDSPVPASTQEFRDDLGAVMLAVRIPLFHWGENRRKVRRAQLDEENARLDLQKNRRLLQLEAEQAVRNVSDGYALVETARTGLRQAEANLRDMQNRYAAALSPLTDLLDAQSLWQQAQSNLIEALTQYKIYETEYLRATGRLE